MHIFELYLRREDLELGHFVILKWNVIRKDDLYPHFEELAFTVYFFKKAEFGEHEVRVIIFVDYGDELFPATGVCPLEKV